MEKVTEGSEPVGQASRGIEVLATEEDGTTPMIITIKFGEWIYVYLDDTERAALIEALGGTA